MITGPTTGNNYDWIDGLYDNGAKGSFDAVGVHTDTACLDHGPDSFYREGGEIGQYSFLGYQTVHGVMAAHGDGDTPIWMTELGWSSTNKTCSRGTWAGKKPAGVGEAKQAIYLKDAYHCLALDPYVQVAMWFNLQDLSATDTEMNRYGLLRADHSAKPSWGAFHDVAVNGDQETGECAKLTGPSITVAAPTDGSVYADALFMKASASDPHLHSISFYIDGKKVTGFSGAKIQGGKSVSMLYHGAGDLSYGQHTVTDPRVGQRRQRLQPGRHGHARPPWRRQLAAAGPASGIGARQGPDPPGDGSCHRAHATRRQGPRDVPGPACAASGAPATWSPRTRTIRSA